MLGSLETKATVNPAGGATPPRRNKLTVPLVNAGIEKLLSIKFRVGGETFTPPVPDV